MKTLILMLSLFLSSFAQAGEVGNGGDVVVINGKYYLYDLVEAGVHARPYFDPSIQIDPYFLKITSNALVNIDDAPIEMVAHKLTEVALKNRYAADALASAIAAYSWRIVPLDLIKLSDDSTTVVQIKTYKQLAIRKFKSITISAELWSKLDPANRTALIFHEIFYGMTDDFIRYSVWQECNYQGHEGLAAKASYHSRVVVGAMFSPEFRIKGLEQFEGQFGFSIGRDPYYTYKNVTNEYGNLFVFVGSNINITVENQTHYSGKLAPEPFAYDGGRRIVEHTIDVNNVDESVIAKMCSRNNHIVLRFENWTGRYSRFWDYNFTCEYNNSTSKNVNLNRPFQGGDWISRSNYTETFKLANKYLALKTVMPKTVKVTKFVEEKKKKVEIVEYHVDIESCVNDVKAAIKEMRENPFK